MKKNLIRYYIIPFVGFLIIFLLKALFSETKNSFLINAFIVVGFALGLSIIVGTLYYFFDTQWGPRKRARMLSRSPFKELKEQGFRESEKFVWGIMNGYTVIVSYGWFTGKSAINIEVLFHPKSFGRFLSGDEIKEISKRNRPGSLFNAREYTWQQNAIGDIMEYNFKPPSYEKVIIRATEFTEILRKENLKPITIEESEKLIPDMNEWLRAR